MNAPASPYVACVLVGGPHNGETHRVPAHMVPGSYTLPPRINRPNRINENYLDRYLFSGDEAAEPYRFDYIATEPREHVGQRAHRASQVPDDEKPGWAPYSVTKVRDEAEYAELMADTRDDDAGGDE